MIKLLRLLAMGSLVGLLIACNSNTTNNPNPEITTELVITYPSVPASNTSQFIQVKASGAWKLEITYLDANVNWCSTIPSTGIGNQSGVVLSYSANDSGLDRSINIRLICGTDTVTQNFVQDADNSTVLPTVTAKWIELPELTTQENEMIIPHSAVISNVSTRSYTMLYDKQMKIAYWVAYPLCRKYMGGTGRTDAWSYDPYVTSTYQANLSGGISGYDRGHQIPSADRTINTAANSQTFYFTNMTPQLGSFNQGLWANLENWVRSKATLYDTMYVVTGAILKTVNGNEPVRYASDRSSEPIAVPNYYFKVLLGRNVSSNTYSAIGFWYQHKAPSSSTVSGVACKSIREIEALTGYNFFANLPTDIQNQVETTNNASTWGL